MKTSSFFIRTWRQVVTVVLAILCLCITGGWASEYQFEWKVPAVQLNIDLPYFVAVDAHGNVYVPDINKNYVKKMSPTGVVLGVWGSTGTDPGQFQNPFGIAVDSRGDIYVADAGNFRIQKLSSNGDFLNAWGSQGSGPGQFQGPVGVAVDGSDNIYVVDFSDSRVQKLSQAGDVLGVWGGPGSDPGQFQNPIGIAVDGTGNVYVTDRGNNRIQKLGSNGDFWTVWASSGSNPGQFLFLAGLAVDSAGNVYVSDVANSHIQKLSPAGVVLDILGSQGANPGQFTNSYGVAVDGAGNIYVADTFNGRIQKLNPSGNVLDIWSNLGNGTNEFHTPNGVAIDGAGNIYVADTDNHRIKKLNPTGDVLNIWVLVDWISGLPSNPNSIAVDDNGTMYVTDYTNNRIQKLSPSGGVLDFWGGPGTSDGQFMLPDGIAVDSLGNVYVTDSLPRIQKLNPSGGFVEAWGSPGRGPGQFSFLLNAVSKIAVDASGYIFVADNGNGRIQKLSPTGSYVDSWGSTGSGPGQFNFVSGIALDASGHIFVADSGDHRIQKLSTTGSFVDAWGSQGNGPGQFYEPKSIAIDGNGNVYVSDTANHRVQKFNLMHTLSASATGNGTGSVSTSIGGISFAFPEVATSSGLVKNLTPVILTASADANSVASWQGACDSQTGDGTALATCTVALTADTLFTANFTRSVTITATVQTAPAGLSFSVDGSPFNVDMASSWQIGSNHTLSTSSPQTLGGVLYAFTDWSDGGAISHTVTVPATVVNYLARFAPSQPAISGTASSSVLAGSMYNFNPVATNATSFRVVNLPSWMTFNNTTGTLSGTPGVANVGTSNNIVISALNGSLSASLPPFSISVVANSSTVTIQTSLAGRSFIVDGVSFSTPRTFTWVPGSSHTITTTSPQGSGGTRYVFNSWSDGGAISHSVTAVAGTMTLTANFVTQYRLTTSVSPGGSGSVTPASGSYYAEGSQVNLLATPAANYMFSDWSSTSPVASRTNAATTVTMTGPISVKANMVRAPQLTASITNKQGANSARVWTITLSNGSRNTGTANAARIEGVNLSLASGIACTPVISRPTSFPLNVGTINAGRQGAADVTINFTGCASTNRYNVTIPFSSNGGVYSSSTTMTNQRR